MEMTYKKNENRSFLAWISDTARAGQVNLWRQLGIWALLVVTVLFLVPRVG